VCRRQVRADELVHAVDARSGDVRHAARRLTQRELDEPVRDLAAVDRLEPEAARQRDDGQLRHRVAHLRDEVVELGRVERRPGHAGLGHDALRAELRVEVAEHRVIDALRCRHALVADDRDVDDVPHAGPRGGLDEVPGLRVVPLLAAGAVDDGVDALDGGLDPLAGRQVAHRDLHSRSRIAIVAAQDPDPVSLVEETVDDDRSERPAAARDEDRLGEVVLFCVHENSDVRCGAGLLSPV